LREETSFPVSGREKRNVIVLGGWEKHDSAKLRPNRIGVSGLIPGGEPTCSRPERTSSSLRGERRRKTDQGLSGRCHNPLAGVQKGDQGFLTIREEKGGETRDSESAPEQEGCCSFQKKKKAVSITSNVRQGGRGANKGGKRALIAANLPGEENKVRRRRRGKKKDNVSGLLRGFLLKNCEKKKSPASSENPICFC